MPTYRTLSLSANLPTHYLVKYTSDDKLQVRTRNQIKFNGDVAISGLYEVQWGKQTEIDTALILECGTNAEMKIKLKERQSAAQESTHQPTSTENSNPKPGKKQAAKTANKAKPLAKVIVRGPIPALPDLSSESSDEEYLPIIPTPSRRIQAPSDIDSDQPAPPTFTAVAITPMTERQRPRSLSPTPTLSPRPLTDNRAPRPLAPLRQPSPAYPTETLTILNTLSRQMDILVKQQTDMEGRIGTKLDNFGKRLATIESKLIVTNTRLDQIADNQMQTTNRYPDNTPEIADFTDVPEAYRLTREQLDDIQKSACGPGNFATKIVRILYPELFGPGELRKLYNYSGGGPKEKRELDPVRREVVKRYTTAYFPDVTDCKGYKDRVIQKINEFLRRPEWSKKKQNMQAVADDDEEQYHTLPDYDREVDVQNNSLGF